MPRSVVTRVSGDGGSFPTTYHAAVAYGPLGATPPNPNGTDPGSQTMDIYAPTDTSWLRPILVFIPGGGWVASGTFPNVYSEAWRLKAQHMGYAAFLVAYRTAGNNFSGTPNCTLADEVADVYLALEWIYANAATYGGDRSRMLMVGQSAGGQLALLCALTGGSGHARPNVCIAQSAAARFDYKSDMSHQLGPPYIAQVPFATGVASPAASVGTPNDWYALSPYYLLSQGKVDATKIPRIYLQHGDADTTVDVWVAQTFDAALTAAGVSHAYTQYAGLGHVSPTGYLTENADQAMLNDARARIGSVRLPVSGRRAVTRLAVA